MNHLAPGMYERLRQYRIYLLTIPFLVSAVWWYRTHPDITVSRLTTILCVAILVVPLVSWLSDRLAPGRGAGTRDFRLALNALLNVEETPFILRVTSGSSPVSADHPAAAAAAPRGDHWEHLAPSALPELNTLIHQEIRVLHLDQEIATAILAVIPDDLMSGRNLLFYGTAMNEPGRPPAPRGQDQEVDMELRPVAVFAWEYAPPQAGAPARLVNCRVLREPRRVRQEFARVVAVLHRADASTWLARGEEALADTIAIDTHKFLSESARVRFVGSRWFRRLRFLLRHNSLAAVTGLVGYILSPFSPWNDAVVNVAPSVFLATWLFGTAGRLHVIMSAVFYVLSNVLGIALLMLAFRLSSIKWAWRLSAWQWVWMAAWSGLVLAIVWGSGLLAGPPG